MTAPNAPLLLIEDHADTADAIATALRTAGYDVVVAGSGNEALRLLMGALRPCLIILDLKLPDMHGTDFRAAQRQQPAVADIPILVVSGINGQLASIAAQLGAVGWLRKPVSPADLLAEVRAHCPLGG